MSLYVYLECPCCQSTLLSRNITHNLGEMANAVNVYKELWHPEELGINKAEQLIEPLTLALSTLKGEPDKYKEFNPPNGWGDYKGLMNFIADYLEECKAHPEAKVRVWG